MKKNPLVIYHANCNDGFGAAYAAWRALRDFAEYLPMQYGDPVPDVAGRNVFIFDFSFSPEQMNEIYEASSTLVWRDHHKTAIEALPQIAFLQGQRVGERVLDVDACYDVLLDPSKSGCILAWEYFFKNDDVPRLLEFIDDRDRWQFKLKGTKELHAFLTSVPRDFQQWHCLAHSDLSIAALSGSARASSKTKKGTTMSSHFNGLTPAQAERLALLIEECGEVIQAATKILRHGYDSKHPDTGLGNRSALVRELGDLNCAVDLMARGGDVNSEAVSWATEAKMTRFHKTPNLLHHNHHLLAQNQEGDLLHV